MIEGVLYMLNLSISRTVKYGSDQARAGLLRVGLHVMPPMAVSARPRAGYVQMPSKSPTLIVYFIDLIGQWPYSDMRVGGRNLRNAPRKSRARGPTACRT